MDLAPKPQILQGANQVLIVNPYREEVTDGLLGWWPLDEGTGSTALDKSGNGRNGTYAETSWTDSFLGKTRALFADTTTPTSSGMATGPFTTPGVFTFCARCLFKTASQIHQVGGQFTSGSAGNWFLYRYLTTNKIHVDIPWVLGDVVVSDTVCSATDRWYHIALERTGTTGSWTWKLFIDGVLDKTTSNNASNPVLDSYPFISGYNVREWIMDAYNMSICDLMLFNRPLSSGELSRIVAGY